MLSMVEKITMNNVYVLNIIFNLFIPTKHLIDSTCFFKYNNMSKGNENTRIFQEVHMVSQN